SLDADVVALQEVAVLTADGILHDNAGMLAARTGMQHRYAATRHFAIHDADGRQLGAGLFGNALLSRIPIRTARTLALPMATDDASVEPPGADHPLAGVRYADAPASTREPRCLLIAEVELPAGAPATIGSVHLSHIGSGERALQAAACVRALSQVEGPVVLAGDLNAAIDSAELAPLRDGWTDAFGVAEIPAGDERRATTEDGAAIDHIFVRGAVVLDCRRVDEAGWLSDHLPLLAELEIRTTTLDARQIGYEDS
ncbi:MAG: endonuclease/exonuclease/phosphatase family protein, partial [Candidatus Limnocylindria bacterium]